MKATAETEKDAMQASSSANDRGDLFGSAPSKWIIVKFEWTSSSRKLIIRC